ARRPRTTPMPICELPCLPPLTNVDVMMPEVAVFAYPPSLLRSFARAGTPPEFRRSSAGRPDIASLRELRLIPNSSPPPTPAAIQRRPRRTADSARQDRRRPPYNLRRRTDMRSMLAVSICAAALLQTQSSSPAQPAADDPVKTLVGRLDLDTYKATIK